MNDNFLTLDQFHEAMKKIDPVFDVERRLPEQVFKRSYRFHLLSEFDYAMDDLLKVLQKTRSPLTDETVLFCVLEADPINFFYKEFQKIYGFYFKANISVAEYYSMHWVEPLPKEDPFPFHTELEVYLPESASWAMWGERSPEIAVIGLDDVELAAYLVNENGYWMDAETALHSFAKMRFLNQKVPEDFRRALIANYGSRADLEKELGRKVEYPWEKKDSASRP